MNRNIILLFLSDYRSSNVEENYWFDGTKYTGVQTNDAPVKLLLDTSKKEGNEITDIFCIASDEVRDKTFSMSDGEMSSYKRFEHMVQLWAKELEYSDNVKITAIPYKENEKKTTERMQELYRAIYSNITDLPIPIKSEDAVNVYIDYTGGMRDTTFFMTVIIRYLEFAGVRCRRVVYSYRGKNQGANILYDISFIYEMFRLINGTYNFMSTGNAVPLQNLYEDSTDSDVKEILSGLVNFSNKMALCRTTDIDEAVKSLEIAVSKIETLSNSALYSEMFASLLPVIKKKMGIGNKDGISIPGLISWCLENNMLQQAVTLYAEKMPEYYFREKKLPHGIYDWDAPISKKDLSMGETEYYHKFYTILYDVVYAKRDRVLMLKYVLEEIDVNSIRKKCNRENLASELIKEISSLKKHHEEFSTEIERLIKLMKKIKGWKQDDAHIQIYGKSINNDVVKCYNRAISEAFLRHYLIFDNIDEFKDYSTDKGLLKKYYAIEGLDCVNEISDCERKYLKSIMSYYLVIKIIRNHLNHAMDDSMSEEECKILTELTKAGVLENSNIIDYQSIVKIVSRGIRESVKQV